jgi:uncharacterized protein (TIGR02594 family)
MFNFFKKREPQELPWIVEGKKVFGLHEVRDNAALKAWLRSDGKTLGDPKALPWCGDYLETAIKNSLPNEPFVGPLAQNPYWARNWVNFGIETEPVYGAIVVLSRGSGGHVGFLVGQDSNTMYLLGGNQGDTVNISRMDKNRVLAYRWPATFANPKRPVPTMSASAIPLSVNEF